MHFRIIVLFLLSACTQFQIGSYKFQKNKEKIEVNNEFSNSGIIVKFSQLAYQVTNKTLPYSFLDTPITVIENFNLSIATEKEFQSDLIRGYHFESLPDLRFVSIKKKKQKYSESLNSRLKSIVYYQFSIKKPGNSRFNYIMLVNLRVSIQSLTYTNFYSEIAYCQTNAIVSIRTDEFIKQFMLYSNNKCPFFSKSILGKESCVDGEINDIFKEKLSSCLQGLNRFNEPINSTY